MATMVPTPVYIPPVHIHHSSEPIYNLNDYNCKCQEVEANKISCFCVLKPKEKENVSQSEDLYAGITIGVVSSIMIVLIILLIFKLNEITPFIDKKDK